MLKHHPKGRAAAVVHEQASPDPCWQFFAMIECYQDEQYPFQDVDSVVTFPPLPGLAIDLETLL